MSPQIIFFVFAYFSVVFVTGYLINSKYKHEHPKHRYSTLDGLRGLLAIAVVVHHSSIWLIYTNTQIWQLPNSAMLVQLGQLALSLFFMISSFLFVQKLIHFKGENYNWKSFFIRRFYRLTPIYLFSVLFLFIVGFGVSGWELKTDLIEFFSTLFIWITFTVAGQPDINKVSYTMAMNAGVTWSLTYEWMFYFALPTISLFILKKKPAFHFLLLGTIYLVIFYFVNTFRLEHVLSILGGIVAAFILKYNKGNYNYNNLFFNLSLLFCLVIIALFESVENSFCKIFITALFTLFALGNNLFGILNNRTLKFLGEISYSIYLLHGILLFLILHEGVGIETLKTLSRSQFWFLLMAIAPVIVFISFMTYHFIEKPFIKYAKNK